AAETRIMAIPMAAAQTAPESWATKATVETGARAASEPLRVISSCRLALPLRQLRLVFRGYNLVSRQHLNPLVKYIEGPGLKTSGQRIKAILKYLLRSQRVVQV